MTAEDRATVDAMLASPTADTELTGHVGLRNLRQRLNLLYGEKGELRLEQITEDRILAYVRFPISKEE